ncbi:MAG: MBL fold metallo-hydrolase [Brevinema sp.]
MNSPEKIADSIYKLHAIKPTAHSYLLTGEKNILIDVGTRETFFHLKEQLYYLNLHIDDIDQVILTHSHYDHTGALEYFGNSEILCHPLCFSALDLQDEECIYALKYQAKLPVLPKKITLLQDNDHITNGSQIWKIIFTPGHSIDGICLLEQQNGILISGDTLFARGIPALITHSGSDSSLFESIKKLETHHINLILPGHGITDNNPTKSLLTTKEHIINRIKKTQDLIKNGETICKYQKPS